MKKLGVMLVLLVLSIDAIAINLFENMVPMSLVSYNGEKENSHKSFGMLVLTYDRSKAELLPLISFSSFMFRKSGGECFAVQSDISEEYVEGNLINFRGKEAVSATADTIKVHALDTEYYKRDAYEYGHSFLLTDIGEEGVAKYRLEVTRFFKLKKDAKNMVWVYESRTPIVDSSKSPCANALDNPAGDVFR